MQDKIRNHIDGIFEDTTPTRKAAELREEMIQNLEDKYKDLIAKGKSPEAAYNIAIAGIGDISGLLEELEREHESSPWAKYENEAARKKSAMLTSIAVMMYILCALPLVILALLGSRHFAIIGLPVLFIMVAGATGLLIYNSMIKPKYEKESDTLVEEFREWKEENKGRKSMRSAISSALWTMLVCIYFIVSFTTGAWHITWIIFILGAAIESFINIFMNIRK
jgi:hypothetical protein